MGKGKSDFKTFLRAFFILIFGVGIFLGFFFLGKSAINWDGKDDLNIMFIGDSFWLGNFSVKKQKLVLVSLPSELMVETYGGYGSYPVTSIWDLYRKEKKSAFSGCQETILRNLAVYADGYFYFGEEELLKEEFLKAVKTGKFGFFRFLQLHFKKDGSLLTNFSMLDYYRLMSGLKKLGPHQIEVINLSQKVLRKKHLADGSLSYTFDKEVLDSFLAEYFLDVGLVNEDLRIAVLNATGKKGLAQIASRIITNMGGKVIFSGNYGKRRKNSEIKAEKETWSSYTFIKIAKVFRFDRTEAKSAKGDIEIILGEDWLGENLDK